MTTCPPILPGCSVLPPMEPVTALATNGKPKSRKRKAADRFAVLNAFIDVTAAELSRSEIMVWLVLYRDTKNSVAKTSQADIARRAGISARTVRRVMALSNNSFKTSVFLNGLDPRLVLKERYHDSKG